MVNTKIILIIFFAAKDGEALYSQQKQDQELNVAHVQLFETPWTAAYQATPSMEFSRQEY